MGGASGGQYGAVGAESGLWPALESLGGLLESFRNLADVAEDRLADAYENVLLPLAQWAIQDGGPNSWTTWPRPWMR